MSSNLLKGKFTSLQQDDKRVIDTNELVAKRIEALSAKMRRTESDGFVPGLDATEVSIDAVLSNPEEESDVQNNVMKAGEDAKHMLEDAKGEANGILEAAKAEAERILEQAKKDAAAECDAVLAHAREQGYADGKRKAEEEAEKQRQQYVEKKKQLEEEYQHQIDVLEPQFIETLTGIYEHIFHVELSSYREILVYLIASTLRKIEGVRSFMIHVSADDYPYVSMEKKQLIAVVSAADSVIEVIEDMTLSKNECLIETESGIFDCGLGTQLEELTQKMKLLSYQCEK